MPRKKKTESSPAERLEKSTLKPAEFMEPAEIANRFFFSVESLLSKTSVPLSEDKKQEVAEFIKEDATNQYLEKAIDSDEHGLPAYWDAYCLYMNGVQYSEVSKALNIPEKTIQSWNFRHGWAKSKEKVNAIVRQQIEQEVVKKKIVVADRLEPFIDKLEMRLTTAIAGLEDKDVLKYYLQITDFYAQLKGQKKDQQELKIGPNEAFEQIILNAQRLNSIPTEGFKAELIEPPKLIE